jgi:hypothetical protein
MYANRRGAASVVAHTDTGEKPTPVNAMSRTVRCSVPLVTAASPSVRAVSVPLGIIGSLPSGRLASAAIITENVDGVPAIGEYRAAPCTACSPLSDVDFQRAASPLRVKVSFTLDPNVVVPVTWYFVKVPSAPSV